MSAERLEICRDHVAHPVVGFAAVDHDAFDVFGEEVAHGALDQVGFLEDARRRRLLLDSFLNCLPFLEQQREVAHEITRLLAFADGADDDAHAFRNRQLAQNFFQALAFFLILDLARDAALVRIGQQHQITSGQHEVRRDARAFGADRAFGHLHDDFAAGRIKARNVLLRDARFVAAFASSRSTISTPLSKLLGTMSQ